MKLRDAIAKAYESVTNSTIDYEAIEVDLVHVATIAYNALKHHRELSDADGVQKFHSAASELNNALNTVLGKKLSVFVKQLHDMERKMIDLESDHMKLSQKTTTMTQDVDTLKAIRPVSASSRLSVRGTRHERYV